MRKTLFILALACFNAMLYAQAPAVDVPALIWSTGSGQSGVCWNAPTYQCSTSICLGESVCFAYSLQGVTNYNDYASNHVTMNFSDGGSIVIENTYYTGPNATGCVNYTPTSVGAVVTNTNTGSINMPFTINVLPATPPVLSANISPSNPVCVGTQVCAYGLTAPVINYSFTSSTAIACSNPTPCPNGATSFCFPAGNHQIRYTVNAGHTCSNTAVYNVNVINSQVQITVDPPESCDDEYCFTAAMTGGCTIANASYYWIITNQLGTFNYSSTTNSPTLCMNLPAGTYMIFVSVNNGALQAQTELTVPPIDPCVCFDCNEIGKTGVISLSPAANQKYCINTNVTIQSNVMFKDCEVKIKPGVSITIQAGAVLILDHAKFFGDVSMWSGIVVQNGGRLAIRNNSLLEDAIIGVDVYNNSYIPTLSKILSVDNSIFNKNQMDIRIYGYTRNIAAYPFSIINSLFTCRVISPCDGFLSWPATNLVKAANNPVSSQLETPYINNTLYPVTTLKAPYAGKRSSFGIRVENVGYSDVSTSTPVYAQLEVGILTGKDTYNVFDNHYTGIDVINSNVSVVNCIFQNGWSLAFPGLYSCGIKAVTQTGLNNRLLASTPNYTNNNKFYDLSRAIRTQNYFDVDIRYCEMKSTRVYDPAKPVQAGVFGISMESNHYNVTNASYNRIFNIDNGIDFKATVGSFTVGTTNSIAGQYVGALLCNSNLIRSNTGTPVNTLHYGYKGITVTGLVGANRFIQPWARVETNDNTIQYYVNGISCNNWRNLGVSTKNNTILISQYAANTYEYGIEHANNIVKLSNYFKEFGICNNSVSCISQYNKTQKTYGIRSVQNANQAVLCNTVATTYNALAFSGYHANDAYARFNISDNSRYGFVLENAARIGTQGDPVNSGDFFDQTWLGAYSTPDYKTAVLNSNAQFSKIHVRSGSNTNPNGSGYINPVSGANINDYSSAAGTIFSYSGYGSVPNCLLTKPGYDQPSFVALKSALNNPADVSTNPRALYVAQTQLYDYLRMNQVNVSSSAVLDSFFMANVSQYRSVAYQAEMELSEGNTSAAEAAISGFTPANDIQAKHKAFFNTLFKYQHQTLTAGDKEQLLSLAKGCPSLDGTVVHQARALYNLAYDEARIFEDSCNYSVSSLRKGSGFEALNAGMKNTDVLIYPNPSQGEIFVLVPDREAGTFEMTVSTISGSFVTKEMLTFTNGLAKVNTSLANGVYMISLVNTQTKERVIKKLVIQK